MGNPILRYLRRTGSGTLSWFLVLFCTGAGFYLPTMLGETVTQTNRVLGTLSGFLFSVLLALGQRSYHKLTETLDALGQKITAQWHSIELQEAYLRANEGPYAPLFGRLAKSRLDRIHNELRDMRETTPSYLVRRRDPVEEFIEIFVDMMTEIIHEGSEFKVVTSERIWANDSFGEPSQRYLLANKNAASHRNIKIRRIFAIVAQKGGELTEQAGLAERRSRLEYLRDTLKKHRQVLEPDGTRVDLAVYEFSDEKEYHNFFRSPSNNFAIWKVSAVDEVCTVVDYELSSAGEYLIRGFRFETDKNLIHGKTLIWDHLRSQSVEIGEYITTLEGRIRVLPSSAQPSEARHEPERDQENGVDGSSVDGADHIVALGPSRGAGDQKELTGGG